MAEAFIAESKRVWAVQVIVLLLAGVVLFALLWQLFCVVSVGFQDHLGKAEEMLMKVAERPRAALAPEYQTPDLRKASTNKRADKALSPASAASSPSDAEAFEVKSLHELLATGLKSLSYSTVAVISILVVAISVITIAIAKVVFAMAPHRLTDDTKSAGAEAGKDANADSTVVLPNLEFAKEFTKLVADLFKSPPK